MEKNVCVLTPMIDVYHGNYLMAINVYIINTLAQLEPLGMENHVSQPQMIVHKDFIKMELNANHFLKDVFIQQFGKMIVAFQQMDHVLMELLLQEIHANLILHVKMDKTGILLLYSVYVLGGLDGVVKNVLYVQEVKSGIYMMVVLAPKVTSWLGPDVKSLHLICVSLFQMLIGIQSNSHVFVN